MAIFRKFIIDKTTVNSLSEVDKKVLVLLEEVVELFAEVYLKQINDGFYPDISKKEIEKAAKKDPEILSPFTSVVKDGNKLKAIPFHIRYQVILQGIFEKINQAANISNNKSFKNYLKLRAKSLIDGSYMDADIAWFAVKDSKIDFNIGPFERYRDPLFFIKRAYQAHVGIIDNEYSKRAERIKETLYSFAKVSSTNQHSTEIPKKGVTVLVEKTTATSGYLSEALFSGEHFPCDLELMKKYGSRIIIYSPQLLLKFEKLHNPIFKAIFEKKFASKYSREQLITATGLMILLYELGRQLHKFEGARERLKELYGPIDEANGSASGIQHSKHLIVKGLLSQDELEAIIIIHIVWLFTDWLHFLQDKSIKNYVIGNALTLNTYLENGAVRIKDGISWPNFSRIFFEIESLADRLVDLLQKGSYSEAKKYIDNHASFKNLEQFSKYLKDISPKL